MRNFISGFKLPLIVIAFLIYLSISTLAESFDAPANAERVVFQVGYPSSAFSKAVLEDIRSALEVWGTKLAERGTETIARVETTIFDSDDFLRIYNALKRKEVDCIIMNTLDFVEFEEAKLMEPVFVGFSGEKIGNEYVLLVRRDSGIDSLDGLKNGTINVETQSVGRIPLVWLEVLLSNEGLPDLLEFFKEVHFKEKASHAVLPVFFGKVAAGVTNIRAYRTMVELNPQLESELSVLMISLPYLRGLVVFRKDLDQKIKDSLLGAMEKIHTDPYGQQILMVLKEHKVVPFKPEYTDTVRSLFKEYQKLYPEKGEGHSRNK